MLLVMQIQLVLAPVIDWFTNLWVENQDAILQIPTEFKTILVCVLVVAVILGLVKKAYKLLKLVLVAIVIYFAAVYLGLI